MKIEDYWYDGVEYFIIFETTCKRKIKKNLIFPKELIDLEIEKIVKNKFMSVEKIVIIEEINDVLILKSSKNCRIG